MSPQPLQGPEVHTSHPADDEIDLVDLALIVWRRRRVVLAVILLALAAGAAFAFLRSPAYEYKAVVSIGQQSIGQQWQIMPIETPETAIAKINDGYLPKAIAAAQSGDARLKSIKIEATAPKGAAVVILSAKAPISMKDVYLKIIGSAVQDLLADHASLIAVKKDEIMADMARVRSDLSLLDQRINAIMRDIEQINDMKKALTSQKPVGDLQSTLALLQSRRDQLAGELSSLQKGKQEQEKSLALLESQARNLRSSQLVYGPAPSLLPAGPGRSLILALALVAGAFCGLLAAFVAEFTDNVKARLRGEANIDSSAALES